MSADELPTGQQFELHSGDQRAVVVELGAGLRSYQVAGRELLDTYGPTEVPGDACRGEVLLPFPNRIDGGRYPWEGSQQQLPLTEPERDNAIHGLTRFMSWRAQLHRDDRVTMALVLRPSKGYPFTLALTLDYALAPGGLTVSTTAHNVGAQRAPWAAGHHPYFTVGTERVDSALLQLPARAYLTVNDRLIPTGQAPVAGTPLDFGELRPVGDLQLDTCFTDLVREADGFARVRLQASGGRPALAVAMDGHHDYVQVFTGDGLPDPGVRRRGMPIEPMTAAPNAFRSGEGLTVLAPGESFTSVYRVEASA